jgi:hypothetical protein
MACDRISEEGIEAASAFGFGRAVLAVDAGVVVLSGGNLGAEDGPGA